MDKIREGDAERRRLDAVIAQANSRTPAYRISNYPIMVRTLELELASKDAQIAKLNRVVEAARYTAHNYAHPAELQDALAALDEGEGKEGGA